MEDAWKANQEALEELSIPKIHELKELSPEMERMLAERTQKLLERDTEPIKESRYKEPFVYYEPAEGTGGVPAVICTCGWRKPHYRFKVLQKAAIRHSEKTGHKLS